MKLGLCWLTMRAKGYLNLKQWAESICRQLVGKPVLVGKNKIPGVIGAKPIHFTTADERKTPISLDSLRIDLGPGDQKS